MNNEEKILALLSTLQQDMNEMKQDIGGIQQDIGDMKQDICSMKQDICSMQQDIGGIHHRLDKVENQVDQIKGQQEENIALLRALEHRAEENSAKIEGLSVGMAKELGSIRAEMREGFVQMEARLSEKIDDTLAGVYTVIGEHAVKLARAR